MAALVADAGIGRAGVCVVAVSDGIAAVGHWRVRAGVAHASVRGAEVAVVAVTIDIAAAGQARVQT